MARQKGDPQQRLQEINVLGELYDPSERHIEVRRELICRGVFAAQAFHVENINVVRGEHCRNVCVQCGCQLFQSVYAWVFGRFLNVGDRGLRDVRQFGEILLGELAIFSEKLQPLAEIVFRCLKIFRLCFRHDESPRC